MQWGEAIRHQITELFQVLNKLCKNDATVENYISIIDYEFVFYFLAVLDICLQQINKVTKTL